MNIFQTILFSLLLTISFIQQADLSYAEPANNQIGRLKDGRAFRTDKSGFQLADQLAELEVTVDELQRQVQALEDETIEKQQRIDRLLAGGSKERASSIGETTLVRTDEQKVSNYAHSSPPPAKSVDCSRLVAPLNSRIAELEKANSLQQGVRSSCDYESAKRPLLEQIEKLQLALMSGPSKEELLDSEKVRASLQQSLAQAEQELENRDQRLASLETQLQKTRSTLQASTAQETEVRKPATDVQQKSRITEAAQVNELARARVKGADASDGEQREINPLNISSAKKGFQEQLASIQKLIGQRKDLLDSLKQRQKGISIQIHQLVTPSGKSLDALRVDVSKLSSDSNADLIGKGLSDIQAQLEEDIRVLRRLAG